MKTSTLQILFGLRNLVILRAALVVILASLGGAVLCAQVERSNSRDFRPIDTNSRQVISTANSGGNLRQDTTPQPTVRSMDGKVTISPCVVFLIEDIELPSLVSGQLQAVNVVVGQPIYENEILARIDDLLAQRALDESKLKKEMADFKVEDETAILVAQKEFEYSTEVFKKSEQLYRKGSESPQDYLKNRITLDIKTHQLALAEKQRDLARIESNVEAVKIQAAQDNIERHLLRSNINGNVLKVIKQRGEWVNAGESVLRIARMDRLRVSGLISAKEYEPRELANKPIVVKVELARGRFVELPGRVVYVALEQSGGDVYDVWAEIDNRLVDGHWVLQANAVVDMTILLDN